MSTKKMTKPPQRYSISVSAPTYARLRGVVESASLPKFVDRILASALDDPTILARVAGKCRAKEPK